MTTRPLADSESQPLPYVRNAACLLALCFLALVTWFSATAQAQPPAAPPPAPAVVPAPAPGAKVDVIRDRFPGGAVKVERHVVQVPGGDFVNHGPWTSFFPDGKKIGGGEMLMGKRHGVWSRWFAPGEAMFGGPLYDAYQGPFTSEVAFAAGELDGPWIVFDKNKTKISEWGFKGGVQHGPWVWWYANGQIRREMIYVNGAIDGAVIEYSPEGKVISKVVYLAGRKKVEGIGYYAPRVKRWAGWYLYGPEVAKSRWDWWYGHAETVVTGYKSPKQKHGKWTWWHPNSQKWVEGVYFDGKRTGPWTWWAPDGKIEQAKEFPAIAPPPTAPPAGAPIPGAPPAVAPPVGAPPVGAPATTPATAPAAAPVASPRR